TRDAMTSLAERQRPLREQLARSAEMLRRAALEGAMETLRDDAEELAAAQNELADSLSAGQRPEQSGEQGSGLERRTERLTRDMEQLQERLRSEQAEQGATGVARARPHAEASSESMRSAAEQARAAQEQAGEARDRSGQAEQQQSADQRANDA